MNASDGGMPLEPDQLRRYGRLGGLLFATGALTTLPASFMLEPFPGGEVFLITALGVVSGMACWRLPWERMPGWSLDALTAVGTLEILLVCHVVDETYRVLYFVTVAFAALVMPTRGRVVLQLALVLLALVEPVTHEGAAREHLRITLLFTPVLTIVACAVRYLRETLESRERASRAFAREAIELALRLRRGTRGGDGERSPELDDLERKVDRLR